MKGISFSIIVGTRANQRPRACEVMQSGEKQEEINRLYIIIKLVDKGITEGTNIIVKSLKTKDEADRQARYGLLERAGQEYTLH